MLYYWNFLSGKYSKYFSGPTPTKLVFSSSSKLFYEHSHIMKGNERRTVVCSAPHSNTSFCGRPKGTKLGHPDRRFPHSPLEINHRFYVSSEFYRDIFREYTVHAVSVQKDLRGNIFYDLTQTVK